MPVRKGLTDLLDSNEQIDKDMFIESFSNFEDDQMNKWNLACLFYRLDVEDGFDEKVNFETLVSLVEKAKKIRKL